MGRPGPPQARRSACCAQPAGGMATGSGPAAQGEARCPINPPSDGRDFVQAPLAATYTVLPDASREDAYMVWNQIYDPLDNLALSTLMAALPVAVMPVALALFRIAARWAAISPL